MLIYKGQKVIKIIVQIHKELLLQPTLTTADTPHE